MPFLRGPKILLKYEELRRDPGRELRRLLSWLGLEMADGRMQEVIERHTFERLPPEVRGPKEFVRAASSLRTQAANIRDDADRQTRLQSRHE